MIILSILISFSIGTMVGHHGRAWNCKRGLKCEGGKYIVIDTYDKNNGMVNMEIK